MTELEMMRWILGILLAAGSLTLLVMYFYRDRESKLVVATGVGRSQLQIDLLSAANDRTESISSAILESDAYEALQQHIRKGAIISEGNPLWEELEKIVLQCCQNFKSNLYILAGGDLKPSDFYIALLIKCGISPANMALLVGRSKSTITFRRKEMGKKFFDKDLDANTVDELIRLI